MTLEFNLLYPVTIPDLHSIFEDINSCLNNGLSGLDVKFVHYSETVLQFDVTYDSSIHDDDTFALRAVASFVRSSVPKYSVDNSVVMMACKF